MQSPIAADKSIWLRVKCSADWSWLGKGRYVLASVHPYLPSTRTCDPFEQEAGIADEVTVIPPWARPVFRSGLVPADGLCVLCQNDRGRELGVCH